jgi:hypothetical protein
MTYLSSWLTERRRLPSPIATAATLARGRMLGGGAKSSRAAPGLRVFLERQMQGDVVRWRES